jgi:hypothetical protein
MFDPVDEDGMDGPAPLQEDAWIGLIGWLAALDGYTRLQALSDKATAIVPDWTVANCFQIGSLPELGPFLAYPGAWWWFPSAWQAATAGPAGIALILQDPQPLALILRTHWPKTLAEFARQCSQRGGLALYPFSDYYLTQWGRPDGASPPISDAADLDPTRGAVLSFSLETFPWLNPLLRSPWPV